MDHARRTVARIATILCLLPFLALTAVSQVNPETRVLWNTRWDGANDAQLQAVVDYMVAHKMNTLYVQVYGDGYALYNSAFAPHSYLVASNFDALASAIQKGHAAGIEVHAYINLLNIYSGGLGTPSNPNHIINTHPEWSMVSSAGVPMVSNVGQSGTMIFYCPENPGFAQYCHDVAVEIATNYAVDGIHMDYIRYPMDIGEYCYCNLCKANYNAVYGHDPVPGEAQWDQWRFDNVTDLVRSIYTDVRAVKPLCKVSAATWRSSGVNFQDVYGWLEEGILDAACPMTYTSDPAQFQGWIEAYNNHSGGRHIYPGVYVPSNAIEAEVNACRAVGTEGQALFCYGDIGRTATRAIDKVYLAAASPAPMPWLDGSPDVTLPVLSEIDAAGVMGTVATIKWHSDERTNSRVEYGLTTSYGGVATDPSMVFEHSVPLSGLSPTTTYHYRVISVDGAGNSSASADKTFTTTSGGAADIIIDDGDAACALAGAWVYVSGAGADAYNGDYWYDSDSIAETSSARYTPYITTPGTYEVYCMYRAGANRCSSVPYIVYYNGGSQTIYVNQQINGAVWNLLGSFDFAAGSAGSVKISNVATGGDVVIADAVKFVNVATGPTPTPSPSPTASPIPTESPIPTASPTLTPSPTPAPIPAAPTNLTAQAVSPNQVNLAWTDNADNETNYVVERKKGTGSYAVVATLPADTTTYNNTGLTKNTTYTFRVKATNASGSSAYSNEATVKTPLK